MVHIRYSRWDASLRDSLDSDSVFDQLNDYMNETGDLQQAMRRLMQKGIKQGEKQTKGIDDLLSQVAREMRKLYDEYRLQSAMEEVQQQLDSVLEQEHQTLDNLDQAGQDVKAKQQFLNDLPGKTSEAVEKLTSYRFENSNAEKEFQQLLMQLEQIRKLENWMRREGSLFRGQTPMQFQQSMDSPLVPRLLGHAQVGHVQVPPEPHRVGISPILLLPCLHGQRLGLGGGGLGLNRLGNRLILID